MVLKSKKREALDKEGIEEEEISLIELVHFFWLRKKMVFISTAVFFILGLLIAVTSPVEYISEARILSENAGGANTGNLNALSGLAGLAGISIPTGGGKTAGLSPSMYPEIISSEPFLLDLMEEQFYFQEKGEKMSLHDYFSQERPGHMFAKIFAFVRGIPRRFFGLFKKKKSWSIPEQISTGSDANRSDTTAIPVRTISKITETQLYIMSELENRLFVDAEGRIISLTVKMPEPLVSAQLTNIVINKIIEYVIAYKTEKERQNLQFIEERYTEAEYKFKEAQLRLASFRDANRGITLEVAKTREEQLQAEFNLTFEIYRSLAQQLEQTKIQLKKRDSFVF